MGRTSIILLHIKYRFI